jgi:hypothetical protein
MGLSSLLPAPASRMARVTKRWVNRIIAESRLSSALTAIGALGPGEIPSMKILKRLVSGWSNNGYVAQAEYLQEAAIRCAKVAGPVLECGSGLSTLLCGLIAGRRGIEVYSLEHDKLWYERTSRALARWHILGVHLQLCPLRAYNSFDWYDVSRIAMPDRFDLIICDGPPGTTTGGRYGLLPVIRDRIGAATVILLDDTSRPSEAEALRLWCSEAPLKFTTKPTGSRTYAVVESYGRTYQHLS